MIMERQLQPVIVFSFSRRDCEAYALQMSKLDFNTCKDSMESEEVRQGQKVSNNPPLTSILVL